MIKANVLQRVFFVSRERSAGTVFTIDVDNRQYIVSARHLFEDIQEDEIIQIFHKNQWKNILLKLIGHCENDIDISVLTADIQLSPKLELEPTSNGIILGQDVYFLGFPYGEFRDGCEINRDFPLPFVKKGILSNMQMGKDKSHILFIDGINNPGFSGGPVVFNSTKEIKFKVASVISGYKSTYERILKDNNPTEFTYLYNTGIIISYGIDQAIRVIEENPIGFELPEV